MDVWGKRQEGQMVRKITPWADLVCPPNKATSSQLAEEAVPLAEMYTEAGTSLSLVRVGCWKSLYCRHTIKALENSYWKVNYPSFFHCASNPPQFKV